MRSSRPNSIPCDETRLPFACSLRGLFQMAEETQVLFFLAGSAPLRPLHLFPIRCLRRFLNPIARDARSRMNDPPCFFSLPVFFCPFVTAAAGKSFARSIRACWDCWGFFCDTIPSPLSFSTARSLKAGTCVNQAERLAWQASHQRAPHTTPTGQDTPQVRTFQATRFCSGGSVAGPVFSCTPPFFFLFNKFAFHDCRRRFINLRCLPPRARFAHVCFCPHPCPPFLLCL